MFSIMNRIRSCLITRLLLFVTAATFLCGVFVSTPLAHSPKPRSVAGDADDVGGIRDPEGQVSGRNVPGALASNGPRQLNDTRFDGTMRLLIWWFEIYTITLTR